MTKPTHVMLDLETWGTKPGCAIRSIGAIAFDPQPYGAFGSRFYLNVSDDSNFAAGLNVEPDTAEWWRKQSPESISAFVRNQVPLMQAVLDFNEWWRGIGAVKVWAHGINFDEPIFRIAAEAVGLKVPWHYREVRDTRTLFWLADFDEKATPRPPGLIAHNAIGDAVFQALSVQRAHEALYRKMAHTHCLSQPLTFANQAVTP